MFSVLNKEMVFKKAPDVKRQVDLIIHRLALDYLSQSQIICYRSYGSSSRATARIWSLPQIWQKALKEKPHYIIEVLAEKFDRLNEKEKIKILIHEILHIPRTFSGALLPHRTGTFRLDQRIVNKLYQQYKENKNF